MKLWKIERKEPIGFDEYWAKIIAAHSEERVRELAAVHTADEGRAPWMDPTRSLVQEIGLAKDPYQEWVLHEAFNAG